MFQNDSPSLLIIHQTKVCELFIVKSFLNIISITCYLNILLNNLSGSN